jgi:hypothetical protein
MVARSWSFQNQNLKSATIQKKIGWLNAAVNLAIKENRLRFNPFSNIVPRRNDKQKRLPLNEADSRRRSATSLNSAKATNSCSACSRPRA